MSIDEGFMRIGERTHLKSAPPMYTEREMRLAEREAFLRGWREWQSLEVGEEDCHQAVARIYPPPKITRPRVEKDPTPTEPVEATIEFSVRGNDARRDGAGYLHWRSAAVTQDTWWPVEPNRFTWTPGRLRVWADLLEHPTEDVEDDS